MAIADDGKIGNGAIAEALVRGIRLFASFPFIGILASGPCGKYVHIFHSCTAAGTQIE